ncbi:MAG: M23 family metallopeptidase [Gemmatimonadetes bacterium]|nr:M23 family metallopeptidase [Gemmatimonadota bacterium]
MVVAEGRYDRGFPLLRHVLDASSRHLREPTLRGLVGVLGVMGAAATAGAQDAGCGTIELAPAVPTPGHFFRVHLTGVVGRPIGAEAFGEPLHLGADSLGAMSALAAAPIDASEGQVIVTCDRNGTTATSTVKVSLAPASYPVERLRVDPRFVDPPDSTLAARIARESARAGAVAREAHATPRLWQDPFRAPRPSRVASGYGRARMFNGALQSRHLGTDYAGTMGAPVRALNRGVVRIVGAFYYGGRVVYIDHGAGVTTAYLHLSRHRVAEGDTVARGQVIGDVGATGRVTGPHLHLITRYGGHSLDALSLLKLTAPSAPSR